MTMLRITELKLPLGHPPLGYDVGDRMLVNQVLRLRAVHDHREVVKPTHVSQQGAAIEQDQLNLDVIFAHLIQEAILKIFSFSKMLGGSTASTRISLIPRS